jgi:hypothetical protein
MSKPQVLQAESTRSNKTWSARDGKALFITDNVQSESA